MTVALGHWVIDHNDIVMTLRLGHVVNGSMTQRDLAGPSDPMAQCGPVKFNDPSGPMAQRDPAAVTQRDPVCHSDPVVTQPSHRQPPSGSLCFFTVMMSGECHDTMLIFAREAVCT